MISQGSRAQASARSYQSQATQQRVLLLCMVTS